MEVYSIAFIYYNEINFVKLSMYFMVQNNLIHIPNCYTIEGFWLNWYGNVIKWENDSHLISIVLIIFLRLFYALYLWFLFLCPYF